MGSRRGVLHLQRSQVPVLFTEPPCRSAQLLLRTTQPRAATPGFGTDSGGAFRICEFQAPQKPEALPWQQQRKSCKATQHGPMSKGQARRSEASCISWVLEPTWPTQKYAHTPDYIRYLMDHVPDFTGVTLTLKTASRTEMCICL